MDLTGPHREVDALEDRLVLNPGVEILDLKQNGSVRANHRWKMKGENGWVNK
jgi:hypothetical protein